jgi:Uma2 family endonuclease
MTETSAAVRWTVADLELFPEDDWRRREVIDGELFVSTAPGNAHQKACCVCTAALYNWNRGSGLGEVLPGPGVIFGESDAVIPDVVWVSRERLAAIEGDDDHLHGAPDLVVEVLSPGSTNQRRDRDAKLKLYSVQGVREYWIVDPRARTVAVYRRQQTHLRLEGTLATPDTLESPLLPGFALPLAQLFERD